MNHACKKQYDLDCSLLEAVVDGDETKVVHLLDAGAHVDASIADGKNAVALAAKFHNHAMVRLLLKRGARVANFCNDNTASVRHDQTVMNSLFATNLAG